jgi:hypothetical protein
MAWLGDFVLGSIVNGGDAPLRIYVFSFGVLLVAMIFLLRGSRLAWLLFVLGSGAAAVSFVFRGDWAWTAFHVAMLLLLFAPEPRRYVWRQRA